MRSEEMQEAYSCHEHRCLGLCDRCRIECIKQVKQARIYQDWSDNHYQSQEKKMPRRIDPLARLGRRIRNLGRKAEPPAIAQPVDPHAESDRYIAQIVDTVNDSDSPLEQIEAVRRLDAQLALHPQLYAEVFRTLEEQGLISVDRWRALLRAQP
jgi:hypothetical protein